MESGFRIIQGGMGVGVSNWALAKSVAERGQLGVVSGTGIATVLARRLQQGDPDGHLRRAIKAFPFPDISARIFDRYFIAGGIADSMPFKATPVPVVNFSQALEELTVLGAFTEVFLAKEGHLGKVGINLLEKVQTPTLATLFGAMLAGVDYVLMGAGIPRHIPGALDLLARWESASIRIDVQGAQAAEAVLTEFAPLLFAGHDKAFAASALPPAALQRPAFLAIVSSATLAMTLARKSNGRVDGFIIETAVAGGHNAPPRGPLQLTPEGEPVYGQRDTADLAKIAAIGLPFYLAGGFATRRQLDWALAQGAAGIQIGTAFAFCRESGIRSELKCQVIDLVRQGKAKVFTDPKASPTGFPFKVFQIEKSLSDSAIYAQRSRKCDLGYLRIAYSRPDGTVGYRCAAEPVDDYIAKGGTIEETIGRKCLCNALFATVGLGQISGGESEMPIVTAGDDVSELHRYIPNGETSYSSADVLDCILND